MNWVKQVGKLLPDYYDPQTIPDVGELDELETFVGSKKPNLVRDSGRPLENRDFRMGFRRSRKASAFGNIVPKLLRTYGKLLVGGNVIFR